MLLIQSPEMILLATIIFAVSLFLYVKFLRVIVPEDMIYVVITKKTTMFFGKSIDRRSFYYQFPSWMPVLGVEETLVFQGGDFSVNFQKISHSNMYQESFESDIEINMQIIEPLKTIRFSKSYESLIEQVKRDILTEVREEMRTFDGNEILDNPNLVGESIKKKITNLTKRYGIKTNEVKIIKTTKISADKEVPDFDLNKISKLGENATRVAY